MYFFCDSLTHHKLQAFTNKSINIKVFFFCTHYIQLYDDDTYHISNKNKFKVSMSMKEGIENNRSIKETYMNIPFLNTLFFNQSYVYLLKFLYYRSQLINFNKIKLILF